MFFTTPSLEKLKVRAILAKRYGYMALYRHALATPEVHDL